MALGQFSVGMNSQAGDDAINLTSELGFSVQNYGDLSGSTAAVCLSRGRVPLVPQGVAAGATSVLLSDLPELRERAVVRAQIA